MTKPLKTRQSAKVNSRRETKNVPLVLQAAFAVAALVVPLLSQNHQIYYSAQTVLGALLSFAGIVVCLVSIVNMGSAFTIMADPKHEGLKTNGLYRYSRNPIYSGLVIACFGWSLLLSNVYSFICTAGLVASLVWKISYEEAFLEEKYGAAYLQYKKRVGRFTPWI